VFRKIIIGKGKAVTSEYTTRGGAISVDRGWFVLLGEKRKEEKTYLSHFSLEFLHGS